ncbi:MAG: alcohol dehydrogenase [Anaerolineae bacterium]|nr:MAG: alcohol dehydrogenase [Anaerolineae bacterium]
MRAILLSEHGGPEVLARADHPTPEPGPGQVQIRLHAAGLNHLDIWVRAGWPGIRLAYPHILGADGAGIISALGPGVESHPIGTRVVINANLSDGTCDYCLAGLDNQCRNWNLLGETVPGTYAEYIVVPATNVLPIPNEFDFHAAAASSLVFQTAWHSLIVRGALRASETVLVVGASGGVNTASIQIARYAGAEVFVVGSGAAKLALAESLGATRLIDRSQTEDWSSAVYSLTGKRGVDMVVDNVGTTFPQSLRALRKGGRLLTVGNTGAPRFEFDNRYMFAKHLSIIGSTMGTHQDFRTVMNLVFEEKLLPVLDRTYSWKDVAEAHRRLEAGEQLGKITLEIDG